MKNTYEYQKLRGLKRKLELIKQKGGCCQKCGYSKNIAAFDFHHTDPKEKEYQLDVRHLANTSMKRLIEEIKKCDLLCANCHREIHHPDLEISNVEKNVINISNNILIVRLGKPKCIDCDMKINYGYTRCRNCTNNNRRKVVRPELSSLLKEINDNGQEWCAKKYGVSRSSIRRWIK